MAFFTTKDVWILHGVDAENASDLKPWKLEFAGRPGGRPPYINSMRPIRQIDWSPDGKRLAFVYSARLYVADDFDFDTNRAASVRLLVDLQSKEDRNLSNVRSPRWSPDGKRIAFIRHDGQRHNAVVSVVNVDSGEETPLASDATHPPFTWEQPWSPDGRSLAYGDHTRSINERVEDGTRISEALRLGINIVSIEGEEQRLAIKSRHASCASWSPDSDRIAFVGWRKYTLDYPSGKRSGSARAIWTADSKGRDRKLASFARIPTRDELADVEAESQKRLRDKFGKRFAPVLTFDQSVRFRQGKLSEEEMWSIAALAAAREIGGDFQRKMEAILSVPGKLDRSIVSRAILELPGDVRTEFLFKTVEIWIESAPRLSTGSDSQPIWSRDGCRIAFVREKYKADSLYIVDRATGEERELASSDYIGCVTWSADGKSLVLQSARDLAQVATGGGSTDVTSFNPEIWHLVLR